MSHGFCRKFSSKNRLHCFCVVIRITNNRLKSYSRYAVITLIYMIILHSTTCSLLRRLKRRKKIEVESPLPPQQSSSAKVQDPPMPCTSSLSQMDTMLNRTQDSSRRIISIRPSTKSRMPTLEKYPTMSVTSMQEKENCDDYLNALGEKVPSGRNTVEETQSTVSSLAENKKQCKKRRKKAKMERSNTMDSIPVCQFPNFFTYR
ncbi:hypothetical protein DICVIV_03145 [Dictyocaulus viviparus]|uniref:Uncharacterized protein n=1 Tax=Dictyocaulus viviparus TaxID=29172 RepID=A0A0D8Y201_DICVI|nr:hypothetical protein DICVIV_03145 [Dictyocaulus viviparus]